MKDEIKKKQLKEVLYGLDYIGNKIKNDDGKLELGVNNCKILLDYITNLQEELKYSIPQVQHNQIVSKLAEEKHILQEENKRLKELCDKYEEEHNTAFKLWIQQMKEIPTYEEKKDLKYRINKAIEYINISLRDSFENDKYSLNGEDFEHLLNILQGSDE